MPNPKPLTTFLRESNGLERALILRVIHLLVEAGYDIPSVKYWEDRAKEK